MLRQTDSDIKLVRTPGGYLRVEPVPSIDELRAHYDVAYFDGSRGGSQYAVRYSDEELAHKTLVVDELSSYAPSPGRAFEVGFGEGFVLAELRNRGWSIDGVDFTDAGVRLHNPSLLGSVRVGAVFDALDGLVGSRLLFDLLICNKVLEHVPIPRALPKGSSTSPLRVASAGSSSRTTTRPSKPLRWSSAPHGIGSGCTTRTTSTTPPLRERPGSSVAPAGRSSTSSVTSRSMCSCSTLTPTTRPMPGAARAAITLGLRSRTLWQVLTCATSWPSGEDVLLPVLVAT